MAVFGLAQVLTVMHPMMLCRMEGVYQILNFMTDEDLFTHQLPRASRACEPRLKEQFPHLATDAVRDEIVAFCETLTGDNDQRRVAIDAWLSEKATVWGSEFDVQPLGYRESNPQNPVAELIEMVGEDKVLTVTA